VLKLLLESSGTTEKLMEDPKQPVGLAFELSESAMPPGTKSLFDLCMASARSRLA
jgi:hypothetical protein